MFWDCGPGCRLSAPRQPRRQTFACGAVDVQSSGYVAFTASARALCPTVTVSWRGVCGYLQGESSCLRLREIPAPVLVTALCRSSLSPQLCVGSRSWPWPVNRVTRTVFEKRSPPGERGQVHGIPPGAVVLRQSCSGAAEPPPHPGGASAASARQLTHPMFIWELQLQLRRTPSLREFTDAFLKPRLWEHRPPWGFWVREEPRFPPKGREGARSGTAAHLHRSASALCGQIFH